VSIPENFDSGPNPDRAREAASEMAEVILTALDSFGEEFTAPDLLDVADTALSLLPVDSLVAAIMERLESHGWEKCGDEYPLNMHSVALEARIAWAEILPEVDRRLAALPTSYDDVKPPNLTVKGGRICACDCGCQ
jgi:hypothetical protein